MCGLLRARPEVREGVGWRRDLFPLLVLTLLLFFFFFTMGDTWMGSNTEGKNQQRGSPGGDSWLGEV